MGIPSLNTITSIFSAITLFSFLGYASTKSGVEISEMPFIGEELAFIVYPALISTLPLSHLWAIIFFIMLITLGLSSALGYYEVTVTFIYGMLTRSSKYKAISKGMVYVAYSLFIFLLCIVFISSDSGFYWFVLLDHYACGLNLLIIVLLQVIVLGY